MFKIIEGTPPQWLLDNIAQSKDKLKAQLYIKTIKVKSNDLLCLLYDDGQLVGFSDKSYKSGKMVLF